ncbi:transcriptional regulator GcvA [Curvivirga aplysinae]|uniref:transcriptional regulator GcvA n=1 Tax=Curvivirga aplysinae TaxID=2529852 RepID=UPI0012BBD3EE|nr:transcriptional regulator GcvA [Curvivirga aplysinae]MTI09445.1 transcriptional regulator GcvA [Curvivirga aplysinae]
MKQLPPIAAMRALEAAARHKNFTKTADELNITQSAISHQIRHLEEVWGFKLFVRRKGGLDLTPKGDTISRVIRGFLEDMEKTLASFEDADRRGSLRVSLLQSFAVNWMVPRLPDFTAEHPDIDVWISTKEEIIDFADEEVDVAIRLGGGNYPDLFTELLLQEKVFPVCAPSLLDEYGTPKNPRDLLKFPLLLRFNEGRTATWQEWFEYSGVTDAPLSFGARYPDTNMALQAAINGQGVALVRSAHMERELQEGRVVRLLDVDYQSPSSYYFICPKGRENAPKIKAFRDWVLAQAKVAQEEYKRLGI